MPTRNISLTPDQDAFVERVVKAGVYQNASEAIRDARLLPLLRRTYRLLKKTQPIQAEHDVTWWGPCFIPRSGLWCPSRFTLYRGTLYAGLFVPPQACELEWTRSTGSVRLETRFSTGDVHNDAPLWEAALTQISRRLEFALSDVRRYNRFIDRTWPLACRTGRLQRRFTWPRGIESLIPPARLRALKRALPAAAKRPRLEHMTVARYLDAVAVAYDAAFRKLRPLSALEKYKSKADGRHGGLLDLHPDDPEVFSRWFHSRAWSGTHPWEIVFGHPHGIMVSPRYAEETRRWHYVLWVDSLGWYGAAARMAIALREHEVPFELLDAQAFLRTLEGLDDVVVGPELYDVAYEDVRRRRPDAPPLIRWDPLPALAAITPDQAERVSRAEHDDPGARPT